MSLQTSLNYIIGLIIVLLAASLFPVLLPSVGTALVEVRLPLVMALGVAVLYYGVVQRQAEQSKPLVQDVDPRLERHR